MSKIFKFFSYVLVQEIVILYAYTVYVIYNIIMHG